MSTTEEEFRSERKVFMALTQYVLIFFDFLKYYTLISCVSGVISPASVNIT